MFAEIVTAVLCFYAATVIMYTVRFLVSDFLAAIL